MTDFSKIKKMYKITEPNGFTETEIESIRSIFGVLPRVLEDYYKELGNVKNLNQTQDRLNRINDFPQCKHADYLIIYVENQRGCVWGIHRDDLSKSNPPIYHSFNEKEWHLECEKLMEFLEAMAYLQAAFGLNYSSEFFRCVEKEDIDYLRENFTNKNVTFQVHCEGIEFFGNHDDTIIMLFESGEYFAYSSSSKDHFDEMNQVLSLLGEEM
ncbi:hypothetical protein [Listeria seeligeri]|uniref:hypothetical protein n=1 Tax=Listeria seeligeri TaxID=1640 RepID=UPI0022EBBFE5|nr:hypothetical protein [Listeria seeligeri]